MSDLQCASRIVLARHGEAEYESPGLPDDGGSLSTLGRRQSAELATALGHRKVAHVYTSTQARAVQTGEIVAAALGVSVTTRRGLVEYGEGTLTDDAAFTEIYRRWTDGDLDVRVPGAETGAEGIERLRSTLSDIADQHRGEDVLVITHGGLLRMGVPALVRLDGHEARPLGNGEFIEVDIDSDGWVCRAWPGTST
ncbi:histidine phosphatase family protein [Nocardioides jensenii]|uniref:histidine phosphatase family protein n=1 Tax=Nocardioides jensenii TaxID=1843 RepID=UPI000834C845|nr:histidine phosphatase family protein [Nocardioides jensenii]